MAECRESGFTQAKLFIPSPEAFLAKTTKPEEAFSFTSNKSKGHKSVHCKHGKPDKFQTDQNCNTEPQVPKKRADIGYVTHAAFEELDKKKEPLMQEGARQMRRDKAVQEKIEKLETLKKREKLFLWHSFFLSEYYKTKTIPRGFRVLQSGVEHLQALPEINKQLCAVTNKCSFDLMLLTLERAIKEAEKLASLIALLEEALEKLVSPDHCAQIKRNIEAKVSTFEDNLTDTLKKKYQRDVGDYLANKVYSWKHEEEFRCVFPLSTSDFDCATKDRTISSGPVPTSTSPRMPEVKPHKKTRRGRRGQKKHAN
ncbi:hypothetical protein NDU88_010429 [Pleurodeles waltl]|uniref:Uncharacterized protein n=1 Tax=Pleurodeles waltl TaxID=8319 RepID=A0AAV7PY08_PLEWA|nr:hypothetical protein NDU88_010429 [Pleurodeles waltl]